MAEDGSRLSLFLDEGAHGTHVAGIVGAYYGPDDPLNGLARGVRFLAVKVGNGRLGGVTSHNSVLKAVEWAVRNGAMVANLSFGGSSYFENGREIGTRFIDEVVQNHGLFITVSARNEGPGLSTVGSPRRARCWTVRPSMNSAARAPTPSMPSCWSARTSHWRRSRRCVAPWPRIRGIRAWRP